MIYLSCAMKQTTSIDKNKERHILLSDQRLLVKHLLLFCCVFICLEFLSISLAFAQSPTPQTKTISTPSPGKQPSQGQAKEQPQGQGQNLPISQSKTDNKSNGSSDNKKAVAKSAKTNSPSLSPTTSSISTSSSSSVKSSKSAQKANRNKLEDEGEKQAAMIRNGVDFAKNNFPLILVLGTAIIIIGSNVGKLLPKKASTSHGSAHFASRWELRKYLKSMDKPIEPGCVRTGIYRESWRPTHKYFELPRKIVTRHILVVGPSGAGKSTAIYLPNCHYNKGASFLCTDPKSELWNQTSGHQDNPVRFAPMEPDSSMGFNPIPACTDVDVAERLAIAIVYARGETGDPFWYQNERQLLTALIVHVATSKVPTLTHLYEILCLGGTRLVEILQASDNVSARRLSTSFVGLNEKVLTGTVQGLTGKLSWLENPKVRQFTSSVDYTFDFAELRKKPIQVYFCLNEDDVSKLTELTAAFFNMAMVSLKRADDKYKIPVTFFFDEFGNVGKLSNFEKDITLIRGRNLAVVACLQNIAQLEALYGKVNAKIIWANFNTKFVLNGLENETAEIISKTLGDYTHIEEKLAKSKKADSWLGASSTTESEQHHARPLKNPDELRTHPMEEMIVISTDMNPVNIERIYYKEPINPAQVEGCGKEIPVPSY